MRPRGSVPVVRVSPAAARVGGIDSILGRRRSSPALGVGVCNRTGTLSVVGFVGTPATGQVQRARVLDPARLRLRRPDPLGVSNRDALEDVHGPTACLVNPESYTLANPVEVGPLKAHRGASCLFATQPYA